MRASLSAAFMMSLIIFACQPTIETTEYDTSQGIKIQKGFRVDTLYSPSENDQGSWVALAQGEKGMMYSSDQYGNLYRFPMPAAGSRLNAEEVDSLGINIGYAHGLLWAFNSLYVSVNRGWNNEQVENGSGVYRLTDSDEDGNLDKIEQLLKLEGAGEHGPHSLVLSPDGESIYFIAGNHVLVPDELRENTRLPNNWGEDNLMEPYLDARGHANDITAPGGWIAKMDPSGQDWELISAGYRNPFDMGFNQDGELFAYDADMEWDMGMPWYRPTRICHVTSGSEFGWRTGTGKWPTYYPDALPAVVNLNQGSPTGVVMGHHLKFPTKFSNGLFANDWSFGTMYYVDLKPDGSSYTASREEFLSGTPMPLTDAVAGEDGNLYFATGGRRLESHLFRVSYEGETGGESKSMSGGKEAELRELRKGLEAYHNKEVSKEAIEKAWANLDHEDRHIRYAARMVLEHQPLDSWKDAFYGPSGTGKTIQAAVARVRQAEKEEADEIYTRLSSIDINTLEEPSKLDLLRVYELAFIRLGMPGDEKAQKLAENLNREFPSHSNALDREIAELLVALEDERAVEKCISLMVTHTVSKTNGHEMLDTEVTNRSERYGPKIQAIVEKMPPSEAIFYGTLLSHAKAGWTKELREKYFQWFYDAFNAEGGLSFKATMEHVRTKAMAKVPESEREYFQELSGVYSQTASMADLPQPEGPGKNYINGDFWRLGGRIQNHEGDIAAGKKMFQAALCASCHRMNGEGGINGPDLSQIHTRFGLGEIANAIIAPHDEISDQYAHTLFRMKDGRKLAGRILSEEGDVIKILPNPFTSDEVVEIAKSEVEGREFSPISPMPPGLLNRLNEDEVVELMAYLMSGGDEEHYIYGGEKGRDSD
ncbi:MAG: c-type cytochrome [Bacteroidota bacterium]